MSSIFSNNISFAIIQDDQTWRFDLSLRFLEYFCHHFNGSVDYVYIRNSIQESLDLCQTDYMIVVKAGGFPTTLSVFDALEKQIDSILLCAEFQKFDEYFFCVESITFFNVALIKQLHLKYDDTRLKVARNIEILREYDNCMLYGKSGPETKKPSIVDASCSSRGAALLDKQIELFGEIQSLEHISPSSSFFLDTTFPRDTIHYETIFEETFLKSSSSKLIYGFQNDVTTPVSTCDVLVAYADSLRTYKLAQRLRPKKIMILGKSADDLSLQRKIFNVDEACLYGDIDGRPLISPIDRMAVIESLNNCEISFYLIDPFTYRLEEFLLSLDRHANTIFDFSDVFVNPFAYYKRPVFTVQEFFSEIYSIIKSRRGPSHILGFAPGYEDLAVVKVNTQVVRSNKINVVIESDSGEQIEEEKQIFDTIFSVNVKKKFTEIVSAVKSKIVSHDDQAKTQVKETVVDDFLVMLNKEINDPNYRITVSDDIYQISTVTNILGTSEECEYLYKINKTTNNWTFDAGFVSRAKRIEISNGKDVESLLHHIRLPVKFNSYSMKKHFVS